LQVRLDAVELHRPRQWGACWLAVISIRSCSSVGSLRRCCRTHYRPIDPGSKWRPRRQWFDQSAMADLLGQDHGLVAKNALYRCLDKLVCGCVTVRQVG
jgi:hypothetical protein